MMPIFSVRVLSHASTTFHLNLKKKVLIQNLAFKKAGAFEFRRYLVEFEWNFKHIVMFHFFFPS